MHAVHLIFLLIIAMLLAFIAAIWGIIWVLVGYWDGIYFWMIGLGLPVGMGILAYLLWLHKQIQRNVMRKAMSHPDLLLLQWKDARKGKIIITKKALMIGFNYYHYNDFNTKLKAVELREVAENQYEFYFEFLVLANYSGARPVFALSIPMELLDQCRAAHQYLKELIVES